MDTLIPTTPGGGGKPVRISTKDIAETCEKTHSNVLRDARSLLVELYCSDDLLPLIAGGAKTRSEAIREHGDNLLRDRFGDASNWNDLGFAIFRDARGYISEVIFDREHAVTMASGYDAKLRKRIVDKLSELEHATYLPVPNFADPVAAARAWADQYEARQIADRTKAEIGTRREATAMNTASQAAKKADRLRIELDRSREYATIKRMELLYHGQKFSWRLLKSTASEIGIPTIEVFDANYGTVKAYHADVWREAYALEIPSPESV